jgi:4-diphosphocytidyl-2-C-methyl-D-erythritol kinase
MTFELREHPGITLSGDTNDIRPEDNLIMKAACALNQPERGAHIHITKRIPRGGGLGGGSSNAATTLRALNTLWSLNLNQRALLALAKPLGADVPVFTLGQSAWAEGIGEDLSPLSLPPRWYAVIIPACEVQTAEIFGHAELTRNTAPITVAAFFSGAGCNDLQPVAMALYPEIRKAWQWLEARSPSASMTGSGACLFAAFDTEAEARSLAASAPEGVIAVAVRGLDRLPAMQRVE